MKIKKRNVIAYAKKFRDRGLPLDDLIPKSSEVEEELKKINPLELTPIDAMNVLYKLKEKLK